MLGGIKQKLVLTDLINQLDIADGLKGLLISSDFTIESLSNTSASDFAKILGIAAQITNAGLEHAVIIPINKTADGTRISVPSRVRTDSHRS